jgi:hypothetical protein
MTARGVTKALRQARLQKAEEPVEVRLAKDLLIIAYLAMPTSFFVSDSRCQHAREVLTQRGIDFDPSTATEEKT